MPKSQNDINQTLILIEAIGEIMKVTAPALAIIVGKARVELEKRRPLRRDPPTPEE